MRLKQLLLVLLICGFANRFALSSEKLIIYADLLLVHNPADSMDDGDFAGLDGARIRWFGVADRDAAPDYSNNVNVDGFAASGFTCTITGSASSDSASAES